MLIKTVIYESWAVYKDIQVLANKNNIVDVNRKLLVMQVFENTLHHSTKGFFVSTALW